MKKKFITGFLQNLKNTEFAGCFLESISVDGTDSIEEVNVRVFLDKVISMKEDMIFVRDLNFKSLITKELHEKMELRKEGLVGLNGRIRARFNSLDMKERAAADILNDWINNSSRGLNLYNVSLKGHDTIVRNLMYEYSLCTKTQNAVSVLGFSMVLDSIEDINDEILEMTQLRRNEITEEKKRAKEVRRDAYKALCNLLAAVNLEVEKNNEPEMRAYARRLRNVIEVYRTTYMARMTRYKTAARKAEEEKNQNGDLTPEEEQEDDQDAGKEVTNNGDSHTYNMFGMWNDEATSTLLDNVEQADANKDSAKTIEIGLNQKNSNAKHNGKTALKDDSGRESKG